MNCPQCSQSVEAGAAFCGNCGYALGKGGAQPAQLAVTTGGVPAYAAAIPARQNGEVKALISLLLGITGIVGSLFMAIFGLALGLAGLVLATAARNQYTKNLTSAGIMASSFAILTSLTIWTYAIQQDKHPQTAKTPTASSQPAVLTSSLITNCYSADVIDQLNVANDAKSCDLKAYNGQTLSSSTNAYKVYANKSNIDSANSFFVLAKPALEKDVKTNLPGFKIDSQKVSSFAGSPAYIINTSDKANNIAVTEAAVYHPTESGPNVFILVHATSGPAADLDILEAQWQWR